MGFYNGTFGSSASASGTGTGISDVSSLDEVVDFNGVPTASDFTDGVLYIKDTNTNKLYQLYNGETIELNSNKVDKTDFTFNEFYTGLLTVGAFREYINYTWSDTKQVNNVMYSKNIGTSGNDLELHSGQGVKLNGTDQSIDAVDYTVNSDSSICFTLNNSVSTGQLCLFGNDRIMLHNNKLQIDFRSAGGDADVYISSSLTDDIVYNITIEFTSGTVKTYINGVLDTITNQPTLGLNFRKIGQRGNDTQFLNSTIKDIYIFNDTLTQQEIELYSSNPNKFFNNVIDGIIDNCVLNMPMDGNGSDVKDYQNNTTYSISNYTASCRDEAKQLTYGSQEANYTHDNIGFRDMPSEYFECSEFYDNYGNTLWIPSAGEDWSIEFIGSFKKNGLEQAHGVPYISSSNRVTFSMNSDGGIFSRLGDALAYYDATDNNNITNHLVLTYSSSGIMFAYKNGVQVYTSTSFVFTGGKDSFVIGRQGNNTYNSTGIVNKTVIHNSALTQQEITDNYNSYISQGLLNA